MIHRPFTCTKSHCMYYAGQLEVWSLQNPFSFCSLLSLLPLSSLSLMNSDPPVPSLLPLTYKFLIEGPVSLYLFLDSPFTLLLQFSQILLHHEKPGNPLGSISSFGFFMFPSLSVPLWEPKSLISTVFPALTISTWQSMTVIQNSHSALLSHRDFKMIHFYSHHKYNVENKWNNSLQIIC